LRARTHRHRGGTDLLHRTLSLDDNGLQIYISHNGHALFKTPVFCGFAPAINQTQGSVVAK